jgi:hypothetical protein
MFSLIYFFLTIKWSLYYIFIFFAGAAWWAMASQLAAQEYLMRLQAASRDPSAYAALAAQAAGSAMPNYGALLGQMSGAKNSEKSAATPPPTSGSMDSLKLPSDTEIIKYTSSSTGSKNPGDKILSSV